MNQTIPHTDIAVVTDSTSDIPSAIAQADQISVVANNLIIEGISYVDGEGISRAEFYRRLPEMKTPTTTATAASGVYQKLYERLFTAGASQIISIHAASSLSGIFNAASLAAQAFGAAVRVIDSRQLSLGLGFQAIEAAEAALRGWSMDAILAHLESVRQRVRVFALLDTLEYARRSGRVSWMRANLGTILHIKPFLEVKNGVILQAGEARTHNKGIEHLLALLHNLGELERLAILHTDNEVEASQILARLQIVIANAPLLVNITPVIGAHIGPRGLGFAAVVK